jgi:hypothetical protein
MAPFVSSGRFCLRTLWPPAPPPPLCRLLLVLLPRDALLSVHPEIGEVLTADDDYFLDTDGIRYLILGEARMDCSGKYVPADSYHLSEAIRLNALFCKPQWSATQAADAAAKREAERRRQQEESSQAALAYRAQQEMKREAQRAADDPVRRLAAMEERLALLEARMAPTPG